MTYLPNNWSKPVMVHKGNESGILEDFVVLKGPRFFTAYFTKGKQWHEQQVWKAFSDEPLGPFEMGTEIKKGKHIRIEKAIICSEAWYGTAVYRRLPMTGIWLHENRIFGTVRQLIIPPKEGSFYSVSACNPCLFKDLIFFEGRNQEIKWRIFQSDLDGNVHPDPICIGGNPFVTQFDDTIYLYFSKYRPQKGFDTWVMTQPA